MMRAFAPMESQADEVQALADTAPGTGVQQLDAAAHYDNGLSGAPGHGQVEDRQMAAANRIYEQKLQAAHKPQAEAE